MAERAGMAQGAAKRARLNYRTLPLPLELLRFSIGFLDLSPVEVRSLVLVSKAWQGVVTSPDTVSRCTITSPDWVMPPPYLPLKSFAGVRELELTVGPTADPSAQQAALASLASVTKLTTQDYTLHAACFANFGNLRVLKVVRGEGVNSFTGQALAYLPQLRSLSLPHTASEHLSTDTLGWLTALTSLCLDGFSGEPMDCPPLPQLRQLSIQRCRTLPFTTTTLHHLPLLEEVDAKCSASVINSELLRELGHVRTLTLDTDSFLMFRRLPLTNDDFAHLTAVQELSLENTMSHRCTDEAFSHLRGLTKLCIARTVNADISDAMFLHLTALQELNMSHCNQTIITGATLAQLPSLRCLNVVNTSFVASLDMLQALTGLTSLTVTDISAFAAALMPQLPHLHSLTTHLWPHRVEPATFARVPALRVLDLGRHKRLLGPGELLGLRQLRSLSVESAQLADAGCAMLTNLTKLSIQRCVGLTDAGFAHLTKLKELDMARCGSLQITDAAFASLRKVLKVNIEHCHQVGITRATYEHHLKDVQVVPASHSSRVSAAAEAFVAAGVDWYSPAPHGTCASLVPLLEWGIQTGEVSIPDKLCEPGAATLLLDVLDCDARAELQAMAVSFLAALRRISPSAIPDVLKRRMLSVVMLQPHLAPEAQPSAARLAVTVFGEMDAYGYDSDGESSTALEEVLVTEDCLPERALAIAAAQLESAAAAKGEWEGAATNAARVLALHLPRTRRDFTGLCVGYTSWCMKLRKATRGRGLGGVGIDLCQAMLGHVKGLAESGAGTCEGMLSTLAAALVISGVHDGAGDAVVEAASVITRHSPEVAHRVIEAAVLGLAKPLLAGSSSQLPLGCDGGPVQPTRSKAYFAAVTKHIPSQPGAAWVAMLVGCRVMKEAAGGCLAVMWPAMRAAAPPCPVSVMCGILKSVGHDHAAERLPELREWLIPKLREGGQEADYATRALCGAAMLYPEDMAVGEWLQAAIDSAPGGEHSPPCLASLLALLRQHHTPLLLKADQAAHLIL